MIDGKKIYAAHGCDCHRDGITKSQRVKWNIQGPVTVVMFKEDDKLKYGMSFCGPEDNFDKSYGFKQAFERAQNGFGVIQYKESKTIEGKSVLSEEEKTKLILHNLLDDAEERRAKYQRMIKG